MEGPITFEFVAAMVAAIVAAYWIWRIINNRFEAQQKDFNKKFDAIQNKFNDTLKELQREQRAAVLDLQRDQDAKIVALQTEQTAHRLQVTREYASVQHLEKVENRLLNAIDRLIEEVKGLRMAVTDVRTHKAEGKD